jgi:hypothetical protein
VRAEYVFDSEGPFLSAIGPQQLKQRFAGQRTINYNNIRNVNMPELLAGSKPASRVD